MTLEQQLHKLEVRVRKLEVLENKRQLQIQQQKEFEDKRDEIMNNIGHDM